MGEHGGVKSSRLGGTGRVQQGTALGLSRWQTSSLPCFSSSPCICCMFNYASFPVLIRDLQTALKISSFRACFVLVKFLSRLKEEDNGIKPYAEARGWEMGKSHCLSTHPGRAKTPLWLCGKITMVLTHLKSQDAAWKQHFQAIGQHLCSLRLLGRTLKGKGNFLLFTFFIILIALWAFPHPRLLSFACNLCTFGAWANQLAAVR